MDALRVRPIGLEVGETGHGPERGLRGLGYQRQGHAHARTFGIQQKMRRADSSTTRCERDGGGRVVAEAAAAAAGATADASVAPPTRAGGGCLGHGGHGRGGHGAFTARQPTSTPVAASAVAATKREKCEPPVR